MNIQHSIRAFRQSGSNRLELKDNLTEFPAEIFELADTLEILDLSGNQLSALPDDLDRLHRLRILFCSENQFTELPEVLGRCRNLSMVGFKANKIDHVHPASLGKSLRWLILTDNHIKSLPDSIGQCPELQKLMLAGNRLGSLPATLANCRKLELVRIAANRFESLPACLLELPRLSWLAFAGNPCCETSERRALAQNPISEIEFQDLALIRKLGEGASGFIHQAHWQSGEAAPRPVAVKLFKGSMTSDGLPHSEKTACISAGIHPNLIPVHGKIASHPQGQSGLVMSLVSPDFNNLAGPPSLDSCTRDVYPENLKLSFAAVLKIARDMASAANHLHGKGIMHGDLYAHNILHNGMGQSLLGDFGAASFFMPEEQRLAEALQQIEVRALGCLLEEMLDHCSEQPPAINQMRMLQQRCLHEDGAARPRFGEILHEIDHIRSSNAP